MRRSQRSTKLSKSSRVRAQSNSGGVQKETPNGRLRLRVSGRYDDKRNDRDNLSKPYEEHCRSRRACREKELEKCSTLEEALKFLRYEEEHPKAALAEYQEQTKWNGALFLDEAGYLHSGRAQALLADFLQQLRHQSYWRDVTIKQLKEHNDINP